jgi:hypothetical protein
MLRGLFTCGKNKKCKYGRSYIEPEGCNPPSTNIFLVADGRVAVMPSKSLVSFT